ncbi:DUF58 domain-containing protein [Catenovulum sp. SM1970]|uniref:DUF58 domain-containing protein n=1 Tax=Marinifaba aquimaris TaxID=2741323 RepID=UPI00157432F3|nr:DUF58 domain-containing protein [Marinifaba aquimaris]NTS77848.1 DUF58 domain-containing protein [Marinifaba aquimaris]
MSVLANDLANWLEATGSNGVVTDIKELLYYRGKTGLLQLTPKIANQAKLAGNYLAKSKGRGMEFDEVRHYQTGDDPRMIDWRVTARTGKAHTKLFREEKERPVFVLTDLSQTMQFGTQLLYKSVQACHLSALIAWRAKQRGDRLGGIVFNQDTHLELKPKSRQAGVLQYLHALQTLSQNHTAQTSKTNFNDALARLRRLAKPGSMICIVSDFRQLDDVSAKHLSQLSRHCELIAFNVSDPIEHTLPDAKYKQALMVEEEGKQGQLLIGDRGFNQQYQSEAEQHHADLMKQLKKVKCQIINISAAKPIENQLSRW